MQRRRVVALRDGLLAAIFEEGRPPRYYGGYPLRRAARAEVEAPGRLRGGLPGLRALALLVREGFTVLCHRGGAPAGGGDTGTTSA